MYVFAETGTLLKGTADPRLIHPKSSPRVSQSFASHLGLTILSKKNGVLILFVRDVLRSQQHEHGSTNQQSFAKHIYGISYKNLRLDSAFKAVSRSVHLSKQLLQFLIRDLPKSIVCHIRRWC